MRILSHFLLLASMFYGFTSKAMDHHQELGRIVGNKINLAFFDHSIAGSVKNVLFMALSLALSLALKFTTVTHVVKNL